MQSVRADGLLPHQAGAAPARPNGRVPVGVIGADAPRQIILASGALPVRLFGAWLPEGDRAEESAELLGAVDAPSLVLLTELLVGRHDHLAGLVVCNDSASTLRLFYVLRMLRAQGRLPIPVHLIDAPVGPPNAAGGKGRARQRFVAGRYARLIDFLETLTGVRVDAGRLCAAAEPEQALGRALERMRLRRRQGRCLGAEAASAYRAAAQQPPEQALTAVEAAGGEQCLTGMRTYLTGSEHPDDSLCRFLEERGVLVVGEDYDGGDASWIGQAASGDQTEEILLALAGLHAARPPRAARSSSRSRAEHLGRQLRSTSAQQVVALVLLHDEAPLWDAVAQRREAARQGASWGMARAVRPGQERQAVVQALAEAGGQGEAHHV